jgi:isocitrate dehydrogenase
MSRAALEAFYAAQIAKAKADGTLFSLHLKATMMKVSDPILFGLAVKVFFKDILAKHAATFAETRRRPEQRLRRPRREDRHPPRRREGRDRGRHPGRLRVRPGHRHGQLRPGHHQSPCPERRHHRRLHARDDPRLRQDVDAAGKQQDTLCVIPDSSYAGVYHATIEFCKKHGAFDPKTMGSVPNVGLMAQAAEEYGSHNKTFVAPAAGTIRIVDETGRVLLEHSVAEGDIWRACQTKDAPVQDWVKLAVNRARLSNTPAIFWLDEKRAHDAQILAKVETYLAQHDTKGLDIRVLAPGRRLRSHPRSA